MFIIPAIDIIDGQCVRLTKGEFNTKKVYSADPLAMAKKFDEQGAQTIHIVDLDAARTGQLENQEIIRKIRQSVGADLQVGGGIRRIEIAEKYLNSGINRVVIGTKALSSPGFVESLISQFGSGRIVIALELKQGRLAIAGWQDTVDKNYLDFAKELKVLGVTELLFTDVDKDGSLTEPNYQTIKQLIGLGFQVTASGGISSSESIKKLKKLGASGAIIGKAIYENKLTLQQAIKASKSLSNLTKRIIPCLDVKDGKVVKGLRFRDHIIIGDVVDLARQYSNEGADELVFYDIMASSDNRTVSVDWVRRVAEVINIPFCVAGGIASIDDARRILQSGADKISINSPALENPNLIKQLADEFGSQCVVVGIDSFEEDGDYFVKQYTGNPSKTLLTRWRTLDWAREVEKLGAGEIVLNCMNQDGMRRGYDVEQLKKLSKAVNIPVVASGGAGKPEDFLEVFLEASVDAALAASVFHKREILIPELKNYLSENNIPIRI